MTNEATRYGCWRCGVAGPREAFEVRKARYVCIDVTKCMVNAEDAVVQHLNKVLFTTETDDGK